MRLRMDESNSILVKGVEKSLLRLGSKEKLLEVLLLFIIVTLIVD